jgi:predicted ATPase/DNA-binding XRE family transcriptional regulator
MSFGQRLRTLRRDLDFSQAELGSRAGCSVNTIRKLESDERKPSRELAARLVDIFALSQRERADFLRLARGTHLATRPVLPSPMTRLIGREADVAGVRERLLSSDVRLLTLVGPPGVGKTRLALQATTELQELFRDGAAFVQLAGVQTATQVVDAIAQALGVRGIGVRPGGQALTEHLAQQQLRPVSQALTEHLAQQQLLLALDNFEQVLSAREDLPPLLAAAPQLKILITSREPLGLYGEHLYNVPTLGLPASDERGRRVGARSASETLFLERARAIRPGFAARQGDEALVAAICVRLEGLPLAIELAASRARSLGPAAMLDELSQRLPLLSAGPADFTPRQRSMRGALDWSYALLDPTERQVFGQLTVFAGGATLDAIIAVRGDEAGAVRETVHSLADKSLLRLADVAGLARFVMLEVIHEYAVEQWCRESDLAQRDAIARRHAEYFATRADAAPSGVAGADQMRWLEYLDVEHPNMRGALGWSLAQTEAELAGRLAAGLWPYWRARGLYSEGRRWLDRVLELDALPPELRAAALNGAGAAALLQTDYPVAQVQLEAARAAYAALGDRFGEALAINNLGWLARNRRDLDTAQARFDSSLRTRREIGDRWGEAWTLANLGVVALDRLDLATARALLRESAELFRTVGDGRGAFQALHNLGNVLQALGDYAQARTLFARSLDLARGLDDPRGVANSLGDLGLISLYTGDYATAAEQFSDSLSIYARLGDRRNVVTCIEGLAGVAGVSGRPIEAARLFGLAAAQRESLGAPLLAEDQSRYESTLAAAREQLDDDTWRQAWAEGQGSAPAVLLPDLLA